jgi:sulfate adenylyltransferase subunit 1
MDILKIATAGSVDDGKSTLIGRLLYETNSITQDKLEALETASRRKGLDFLDLSLLTDGLIAEREQGITIDVAHIYFATDYRKYIIADTPGHFEYTRNMVTGASTSQVSLILVDVRNGIVEQTFRHFFIATLLRVPHVVVCVNKMDLLAYSESRFNEIVEEFKGFAQRLSFEGQQIDFIPISSLYGENITVKSNEMPWYTGTSLLQKLEDISLNTATQSNQARFGVQHVVRPKTEEFHDFRGYSGKISSGTYSVGDAITVLPSGFESKIKSITKYDQELTQAGAKESVVITLEDNVDVSRGDMLVKANQKPASLKDFSAKICWFDYEALTAGKTYLLQHGVNLTKAKISNINYVIDTQTLDHIDGKTQLKLNEIGLANLRTAKPIFADRYADNPANGAFILIDEFSNNTVGVGFVE